MLTIWLDKQSTEIGLSVGSPYSSVNLEPSLLANCTLYEHPKPYLPTKPNNDLRILKRLG